MNVNKVTLYHVYLSRGVVAGFIETPDGRVFRAGHQPHEGWLCSCTRSKRGCAHLTMVKELVPVAAVENGAAGVVAGAVPPGVCSVTALRQLERGP